MNATTLEQARTAKARALEVFGRLASVAGVGITRLEDGYAVKVNLSEPPGPDVTLPETIDCVPVEITVVGRIRKR